MQPPGLPHRARDYTWYAREAILSHVVETGSLDGLVALLVLEPEDEAEAKRIYAEGLRAGDGTEPDSTPDDVDWDAPGQLDTPVYLPPEADDDPESEAIDEEFRVADDFDWSSIPPISGGAPRPYEPTPEDWEDYRRWSIQDEARDRARAMDDARNPVYGYE